MPQFAERLRWIIGRGRGPIGWAVGILAAALVAALLWFGVASDGSGQYADTATPASSSSDVLPPEEDADRAATPESAPQDVIPPAEP